MDVIAGAGVLALMVVGVVGFLKLYQRIDVSRQIRGTTPATLEEASHQALVEKTRAWWNLAAEQDEILKRILTWDHDISVSLSEEDRKAAQRVVKKYSEAVKGGKA